MPVATAMAHEWVEYSGHGRRYYYNSITGETTYEKPDALKSEAEKSLPPCPWNEHVAADGRVYYYNSQTKASVWEEPIELRRHRDAVRALEEGRPIPPEAMPGAPLPPSSAAPEEPKETGKDFKTIPESLPDRLSLFKDMFTEYGFSPKTKWAEVSPALQEEPLFQAIPKGHRKQAFAEWQNQRAKEEREERRKKAAEAREKLLALLDSGRVVGPATPWEEARSKLRGEPAWEALPSDKEREVMYKDWARDAVRRDAEAREREAQENERAFEALLRSRPDITVNSLWSEVKEQLADQEAFQNLRRSRRLAIFKDYILGLEAAEREEKRREEEARRERARKARADFRVRLQELVASSELTARSRWSEWRDTIKEWPEYAALRAARDEARREKDPDAGVASDGDSDDEADEEDDGGGKSVVSGGSRRRSVGGASSRLYDSAKALFEETIGGLRRDLRKDTRMVEGLCPRYGVAVAPRMTFEDFRAQMLRAELPKDVKGAQANASGEEPAPSGVYGPFGDLLQRAPKHAELVFDRLREDAKKEEIRREEKKQRRREAFQDLLMDYYYRSDHLDVTWDEAKRELRHRSAYRALDSGTRKSLFEEHMSELRARAARRRKRKRAQSDDLGEKDASADGGAGEEGNNEMGEAGGDAAAPDENGPEEGEVTLPVPDTDTQGEEPPAKRPRVDATATNHNGATTE